MPEDLLHTEILVEIAEAIINHDEAYKLAVTPESIFD